MGIMGNEMIEKCKAAMLKEMNKQGLMITTYNGKPAKTYNNVIIEIIKAMREPTEKMLEPVTNADGFFKGSDPVEAWQKMIDAIIND